jgi:type III secretion system FlhB-like substrate exporter
MKGAEVLEKAVAVKYIRDLPAPFVIAKGKNNIAQKLVQIAREHGISILRKETLSERLFELETGEFVPEEVYEIVAEILAFVYTTTGKTEKP